MNRWIRTGATLALSLFTGLFLLWSAADAAPNYPALTGRVVDGAGILPADVEQSLAVRSEALESKTTDQFVIVTVPSLQGYSIEEFSRGLGNAWRLGQAGKDNGVLLVVAPNERKVRIEAGAGLEEVLDSETSQGILQDEILPQFRKGDFAGGVSAGAEAIVERLETAPQAADAGPAPDTALALATPAATAAPPPKSQGTASSAALGLAIICFGLFLVYKVLTGIGRFIGSALRPQDSGSVSPAVGDYAADPSGVSAQPGYGYSRFAQPALAFGAGALAGALVQRAVSGGRPGGGGVVSAPVSAPSVSSTGSISPGGGGFGHRSSSGGGGRSFSGGGGSFGGGGGASGSW